jgi:hypothetical protein
MAAPFILNEERHESVWTLSHSGLVSTNYFEVTYNASGQATAVTTWTTSGKVNKLREVLFTYNTDGTVATITKKQYDQNGYALQQTMTGTLAYSNGVVANISWVRT